MKVAEETGQIIGYGRAFTANVSDLVMLLCTDLHKAHCAHVKPDLPFRLQRDIPLNEVDYATLYTPMTAKGYIDYPFSEEFPKSHL